MGFSSNIYAANGSTLLRPYCRVWIRKTEERECIFQRFGQKGHKSYQRMCTERITTLFDVKVFHSIHFYTDAKFDKV